MLREVRPGAASGDLSRAAAQHLPPYKFHPFVQSAIGHGIGLSFEESPDFGRDEKSRLEDGSVYTLRWGAMGEGSDNAVVSAMVAVSGPGMEVLWPATQHSGSQKNVKGLR